MKNDDAPAMEPILVTAAQAAKMLQMSEKTLYRVTAPRGDVRSVRVGALVRYRVVDLRAWVDQRAERLSAAMADPADAEMAAAVGVVVDRIWKLAKGDRTAAVEIVAKLAKAKNGVEAADVGRELTDFLRIKGKAW